MIHFKDLFEGLILKLISVKFQIKLFVILSVILFYHSFSRKQLLFCVQDVPLLMPLPLPMLMHHASGYVFTPKTVFFILTKRIRMSKLPKRKDVVKIKKVVTAKSTR